MAEYTSFSCSKCGTPFIVDRMDIDNPICDLCGAVYSRAEFQRAKNTRFNQTKGGELSVVLVVGAFILGFTAPDKWGISEWWAALFAPLFVGIAILIIKAMKS